MDDLCLVHTGQEQRQRFLQRKGNENDKNMQITTSSNADGEFTVGPLDPHQKYKINPIHHNYRFVSSGEQFKMTQILKTSLKAIFCNFQNA